MSTAADSFSDFAHVKKVAILGAGVAGLQAAEQLSLAGKACTLFEKADDVGGIWRENYADFALQVPKELYEFPSYPFPGETGSFPAGSEVEAYVRSFAREKAIYPMVRLNTVVLELTPLMGARRGWKVRFRQTDKAEEEEAAEDFDFVVAATGMYSTPFVPTLPSAEQFHGTAIHSSNFVHRESAAGKKVIVVGGGKSAFDCAVAAAKVAESSTLLFREAKWSVPRYVLDLVPFKWVTYSRFGHATLPEHHDLSCFEKLLHFLASPLKWLWWRIVELIVRFQFGLSGDCLPNSRIELDLFTGGQILSYEFRDMLHEGKVSARRGSIARFTERGVALTDGTEMEVDLILYGTGFAKSYSHLQPALQEQLNRQQDGLYLYRNVFPTKVRDLCFIGAEVSTFNNILTQGLQALWLRRILEGQVRLPGAEAMDAAIEADKAWKRSWMPKQSERAAILQLHKMKYHDQLCKDMGVNHKRKGWNVLAEAFAPYDAADYRGLFAGEEETCESCGATAAPVLTLIVVAACLLCTGSVAKAAALGIAVLVALAVLARLQSCTSTKTLPPRSRSREVLLGD